MSVVFQDFMAYELTVRENIGIGDLDSLHRDELLTRAAQGSGFSQTLDSLPGGLDTLLSRVFLAGEGEGPERGVALSGGQWQRVAIARALLRAECDFLILDEPSSGLDAEAEELLFHRLRERRRDRALLLVTQRLGVVRLADEIVVLDGGRVIERGCHDDLMRADGKYAELFRLQATGYSSTGSSPAA
jgi:ATP-binding cassette subfamily B protein